MSQPLNLPALADVSVTRVSSMTIRELIGALTAIEDRLRHLPTFVPLGGQLVTNPERRLLLRRQRMVIAGLRRRRVALRRTLPSR
ncbi:hypothetical protein GCM10009868_21130 [Terrabacter aerolatus]|uniref:Uncharacterized protein n=1 Tax=Terrabacter aerolatus TaxID=422442 RepID=A0A512D491_9MICO|nr:hypothetical protein [Terrabacter aerolatus]GEO31269.1 hypothetical protein TAE01_30790 [Terrabacter aerolatus]